MTSQSNSALTSSLKSFSRASSFIVIVVGCLVFVGWAFDIMALKSVFHGLVTMKANTAMAFVLAGVSLWLLQPDSTEQSARRIAQACALAVALLGLLTLSEYLFGWDLNIDQLLFRDPQTDPEISNPGRMAPATALNFLMLGAALLLLDVEARCSHYPAQWLALAALLTSVIALVGYSYGVQALYRTAPYSGTALHTALAFLALSIGLLCARPNRGLMVIISSSSLGGLTARRLLPTAVLILLGLGWLRLLGQQAGFYDTEFGLALMVTFGMVALAVVIWRTAQMLDQTEAERRRAEEKVQSTLERIRALHEIDLAITSTLDLDLVLNHLLEKIAHFFPPSAITAVRLINTKTGVFEPIACRNINKEEWAANILKTGPVKGSITRTLVEGKGPIVIPDIRADPRTQHLEFLRQHGAVTFLGVPLIVKDETLGILTLCTREEHRFTDEEIEFFANLGAQAAIAIHNSQLYEEMAKLAGDMAKSNRVKDEFLSVMSHELRTPLNVVMGYTGMIKDGLLGDINPQQEEALDKVLHRANDQLTMINNVLYATVIETEKVKAEMVEVDLGDFLSQLRIAYHGPINKNLTLNWDYPPNLPVIKTDSAKLKHILQNLINNAIKFTEKGNVTVSCRTREGSEQKAEGSRQGEEGLPTADRLLPSGGGRWVELKVADTGVGIPKEHLPIIFEKFRQVDSSETRLFGGVGMGLYIVKQFADLLGGKVEAESEPGEGSAFTVTIPCS